MVEQIQQTQNLGSKAAKTTMLNANAAVRKTQMLDQSILKDLKPE